MSPPIGRLQQAAGPDRPCLRARLAVLLAVLAAALTIQVSPAWAATFTVNTTDDVSDGACDATHCSLREAINAANLLSDTDTIAFAIPGPPPHTITYVGGASPWRLTYPVVIDGTTEPDYTGAPIVELDGSQSAPAQTGLAFVGSSGGSTVRGLIVNRFKGMGIVLQANGHHRVEDNYIGTDATGTLARGNGAHGIFVLGHPFLDSGHNRIVGNVVSANGLSGIEVSGEEDENIIQGNYIGTDASGSAALGNARWGIRIANGPQHGNLIGGTGAGQGNVISANGDDGIKIGDACNPCVYTGHVVQGNRIGTNASGTAALGNRYHGIRTVGDSTTIGGTDPGAQNIISANGGYGILFFGGIFSKDIRVRGNLIGTAADGVSPLGNGLAGIDAAGVASGAIGGTAPGAGNTIAHNGEEGLVSDQRAGVVVGRAGDPDYSQNAILSNSIFSNAGLGIDLRPSGVSPNDPDDADRGPNELQNFPVLTGAGGNTVEGALESKPDTSFRLEFFVNKEPDPSGHGEGERLLGAKDVTTDASGKARFSFVSTTPLPDGQFVSATATDPSNNTSELSQSVLVAGIARPITLTLSPPTATNTLDEEHCVTATVTDGSVNPLPSVTVRFSVRGVNTADGSAPTDSNGASQFCYAGTFTGQDTITAYADTNDSGVQDVGEPGETATKQWVLPASTQGCKVTYGGRITAANGDMGTFGGTALVLPSGAPTGEQEYQDHGPAQPMNVHSLNVQAVICSADKTTGSIFGQATIDGSGTFDYRIDLKDLGEPGTPDTYRLRLRSGYDSGEKRLELGNVQIHR